MDEEWQLQKPPCRSLFHAAVNLAAVLNRKLLERGGVTRRRSFAMFGYLPRSMCPPHLSNPAVSTRGREHRRAHRRGRLDASVAKTNVISLSAIGCG